MKDVSVDNNVIKFPEKSDIMEDHKIKECAEGFERIIELTQSKGGLMFLVNDDNHVKVAWGGDFDMQDMIHMCSVGIYQAYKSALEDNE